jgi:hypothetical protein
MWFRFAVLLALVAAPLFFLFRAGDEKTGDTNSLGARLTLGHEVRTLQACGEERVLWIVAEEAVLQRLQEDVAALTEGLDLPPYTPVFAVVTGFQLEGPGSGFAADYDGRFRVLFVERIALLEDGECPQD